MIISLLKKNIWVINLILVAVLAYVLSQIVLDKINGNISSLPNEATASLKNSPVESIETQKSQKLASRKSYDVILKRNIFGLKNVSSRRSKGLDYVPQTTLNLELLGTVVYPGEKSVAVIKNLDNKKVNGYVENELIDIINSEKVKVIRIENCVAVLERSTEGHETIRCKKDLDRKSASKEVASRSNLGRRSSRVSSKDNNAERSDDKGELINQVEEGVYNIDQGMLDELLSNPNDILTTARVVPHDDGLRFFAIRPNSIFNKIGIKNGDIVHRINDVELNNVENALGLFEELKGERQVTIDLTRRGKKLTFEYNVR